MSARDDINRIRDEQDARRWRKLIRLVGYVNDASDTTVTLFWDDATMTPFIRIGNYKSFYQERGSFAGVIDSIHEDEL